MNHVIIVLIMFVGLAVIGIVMATANAHSGGTDMANCHYDTRTGVYHCHRDMF